MKTEQIIQEFLTASTDIASVVGAKIFFREVPQNVKLPVVFYKYSKRPNTTKDGVYSYTISLNIFSLTNSADESSLLEEYIVDTMSTSLHDELGTLNLISTSTDLTDDFGAYMSKSDYEFEHFI